MSETIKIAQETKRPWAKPLPEIYHTVEFKQSLPGFMAYYFNHDIGMVHGVEIAMWVLVEYELVAEKEDGDLEMQEIRPFVVTTSGSVVDYLDATTMGTFTLVCVCSPTANHELTVKQHLADLGLEPRDKPMTDAPVEPAKPDGN